MEMLTDLRSFFNDVRRRYFPKKAKPVQLASGLPEGLDDTTLATVIAEHFGAPPRSTAYVHLSGWKTAGAYRLLIETQDGQSLRLIYKNAVYTPDHIPALIDLPLRPGPPEYVVYTQITGPMKEYLPKVYMAEERVSGIQYCYILEDLVDHYRRTYTHDDILQAARLLPELHQALDEWGKTANTDGLIRFDRKAALAIETYARNSLEHYYQKNDNLELKSVLTLWPEIARLLTLEDFFTYQPARIIHGDSNFTNIHLHRTNPNQFKLVDWEWAGFGFPYSDLASLLKGTPSYIEKMAFSRFTGSRSAPNPCLNPELSFDENARMYQWSRLDRGLLDSAFLAAQYLNVDSSQRTQVNLPVAITHALKRVLAAYQQLVN